MIISPDKAVTVYEELYNCCR